MKNYPRLAMSEIKALYAPGPGRHWFDPSTMAFFRTVLPGYGLRTELGNFFITAETGPSGLQRFSIRVQNHDSGNIDTVNEFNAHLSLQAAAAALQEYLEALEGPHA